MKSQRDSQLSPSAAQLENLSRPAMLRKSLSHEPEPRKKASPETSTEPDPADALASQLFSDALTQARISSKEVAILLGVSESLVSRWRSVDHREQPSFAQMLRLPPAFHLELNRAMNRHFGFGRALLAKILDEIGGLGVALGA